jgi:DNA processing protein
VWDAVAAEARHVDVIAAASGSGSMHVLSALLELELDGFVEQLPGMRFRRRRRREPRQPSRA